MTEQELRESLISVAPSAIYANESEIVAIAEIAKAYADAQVAAKDAEIKRLLNLHDEKDNEITGYKVEIFQLKAENERLRDALSPAPVTEVPKEDENGLLPCMCGCKAEIEECGEHWGIGFHDIDISIYCTECPWKVAKSVDFKHKDQELDLLKLTWNKRA